MQQLLKYLTCFKKLNVDRSHGGVASHKPILLISILQAVVNKLITSQRIYITPELVALFKANWNLLVRSNHECRISYPFYYLKSDNFWKLHPKRGFNNVIKMSSIFKSFSRLDAAVDFASIDEGLFLLMLNPDSNHILLQLILDEYFSETKHNFNNSQRSQQRIFEDIESKILHEDPAEYRREIIELIAQKDEEEIFLRGSLFKTEIPRIYNNTCAISGMKIDATINLSMVDACHIIPFSESYNDTITNGIALCPNLHRAFDRGLIGIDEGYCVIVNNNFIEFPGSAYQIKAFEGKKIYLPKNICYWPGKENFGNHRERWGLKGKNNFT